MSGLKVQSKVFFKPGRESKREIQEREMPAPAPPRVPRLAKLMALAIRFEGLIRDGVVADYAELARLGHVTRARMTQVMAMLNLAADIQEAVLLLQPVERGKDPITERELRPIVAVVDWKKQRRMWGHLDKRLQTKEN